MFTAKVRKSIYALSAPAVALLTVIGVDGNEAAVWVASGIAIANVIMAFLNVPDDGSDDGSAA